MFVAHRRPPRPAWYLAVHAGSLIGSLKEVVLVFARPGPNSTSGGRVGKGLFKWCRRAAATVIVSPLRPRRGNGVEGREKGIPFFQDGCTRRRFRTLRPPVATHQKTLGSFARLMYDFSKQR